MPLDGQYVPSPHKWVREQVDAYESSDGVDGATFRGLPIVVLTTRGAVSGAVRKTPVMRVEHDGAYALIASQGGAPTHPQWYRNVTADRRVELQDGPKRQDMLAREVVGDEKALWWTRAVDAYPEYADYQAKTDRSIPVVVLETVPGSR
ncbi:nitroreductase family deazaflavin-dependent oxidoreductase [Yinghuangia sp. YIM S09857]|uniref:nitroreductase family deazaflavin-dependent oxidoreductase n=1 Tax=Yinghuangia sp. YIM S09857 TaxID=3436929 RepID=UPI003F53D7AE